MSTVTSITNKKFMKIFFFKETAEFETLFILEPLKGPKFCVKR